MADEAPAGFMSRWALRKAQARNGAAIAPEPLPVRVDGVPAVHLTEPAPIPESTGAEPLPTLADVALLTRDSDYARFVGARVDESVKQAAMKKLFADPHFNVMDGLDTYIDDYGKPDPIPLAMLRQMNQSKMLRLFEDDEEDEEAKQTASTAARVAPDAPIDTLTAPDDHADMRLQQDDAPGRPGPDQGTRA